MIKDRTFIVAIILANLLLAISFHFLAEQFWIAFPLSLALLLLYSLNFRLFICRALSIKTTLVALLSGLALYLLFAFGKWLIFALSLPLMEQLESLYALVQPISWWHYLLLFVLIIPSEEFFWRGFVLEKLAIKLPKNTSVLVAALLYGLAHLFSGSLLLVIAGIVAGTVWGYLSILYRNLTVAVISHLVFDVLLLIIFPLI